jgi:acetyl esterase/lipase
MISFLILISLTIFTSITSFAKSNQLILLDQKYGPHERQAFDLWQPKTKGKSPLVIYIHGGGWVMGSKNEFRKKSIIQKYLQSGIAVAAINYRFLKHAPLQKILREDIAGFVQFMRYHSNKYRIKKEYIMSHGFSAGGSGSLWLATHDDIADSNSKDPKKRESSRIMAAGHLSAQVSYDFVDWYQYFSQEEVDKFVGDQMWTRYHLKSKDDLFTTEGEEIRRDVDMYENISSDDAPIIFWNGLKDIKSPDGNHFMHSPRHAKLLYERTQEVGLKAKIILDGNKTQKSDVFLEVFKFFVQRIKKKPKITSIIGID